MLVEVERQLVVMAQLVGHQAQLDERRVVDANAIDHQRLRLHDHHGVGPVVDLGRQETRFLRGDGPQRRQHGPGRERPTKDPSDGVVDRARQILGELGRALDQDDLVIAKQRFLLRGSFRDLALEPPVEVVGNAVVVRILEAARLVGHAVGVRIGTTYRGIVGARIVDVAHPVTVDIDIALEELAVVVAHPVVVHSIAVAVARCKDQQIAGVLVVLLKVVSLVLRSGLENALDPGQLGLGWRRWCRSVPIVEVAQRRELLLALDSGRQLGGHDLGVKRRTGRAHRHEPE